MREITKNDWENWWASPCGAAFRKILREDLEKLAHGTMDIRYCHDGVTKAVEVGKYQAIKQYLTMSFEEFFGK